MVTHQLSRNLRKKLDLCIVQESIYRNLQIAYFRERGYLFERALQSNHLYADTQLSLMRVVYCECALTKLRTGKEIKKRIENKDL
jgi:hypothetical protein